MADNDADKTEEPTGKRLGEAREKGQVGKSREIDHWFMLLAMTLVMMLLAPKLGHDLKDVLILYIAQAHAIPVDRNALGPLFTKLGVHVALAVAPTIAAIAAAGFASPMLQHGIVYSPSRIMPKFSNLGFGTGLKRMFSWGAIIEFAKGAVKLSILASFCFWLLKGDFDQLEKYIYIDPVQTLTLVAKLALKLLVGILAVLAIIATLDFLYQRFTLMRSLKMTREEVREEHKQSEGDPLVKSKLKGLRIQRARQRMMQAVPKADVVITNPTHYAIALKYEAAAMVAPKVVAKGADLVAKRIRDLAVEHNVPLLENPPLARALYAKVEVDQEIPPAFYKPVAEVIGYVMKLRKGYAGPPPKAELDAAAAAP